MTDRREAEVQVLRTMLNDRPPPYIDFESAIWGASNALILLREHGLDTVTTAEELMALPLDSVVIDVRRIVHQMIEDGDFGPLHWRNPYNEIKDWVLLPATVLYRGA